MIFNITGGPDMSMYEVNEAAEMISRAVDSEAQIIFGASIDPHDDRQSARHRARRRLRRAAAATARRPAYAFETGKFDTVAPVNMDDIEVPAFLRYRG